MTHASHRTHGGLSETYRTRFLTILAVILSLFAFLAALAEPPRPNIEMGFRQRRAAPQPYEALAQEIRTASPAPAYIPPPTRIEAIKEERLPAEPEVIPIEKPASGEELLSVAMVQEEQQPEEPEKEPVYEISELSVTGRPGPISLSLEYPMVAREAGIQGTVEVLFVVEPNGRTAEARVVKSVHPLCDEAALQAIRNAIFRPGRINGQPVAVRVRLPIRFEIKDLQ